MDQPLTYTCMSTAAAAFHVRMGACCRLFQRHLGTQVIIFPPRCQSYVSSFSCCEGRTQRALETKHSMDYFSA